MEASSASKACRQPARAARLPGLAAGVLLLASGAAPAAGSGDVAADTELRIGLLVAAGDAQGASRIRGVRLAVAEANRRGAGGARLALRVRETRSPWLSAADDARELVHGEGCIALIVSPDRDVSHLAAQVATKGHTPVISLSGDSSLTRIRTPWLFRVVPDSRGEVRSLVEALSGSSDRIAAVVADDRTGRAIRHDLAFLSDDLGIAFEPVVTSVVALPARLGAGPVLVWLAPEDEPAVAGILNRWGGPVLFPRGLPVGWGGSPRADPLRTGLAVRLFDATRSDPPALRFLGAHRQAFGGDPDEATACAFDAAELVIAAIEAVGPDREAVRAFLASLRGWSGATGPVRLDGSGNRIGDWSVVSRTFVNTPPEPTRAPPRR